MQTDSHIELVSPEIITICLGPTADIQKRFSVIVNHRVKRG